MKNVLSYLTVCSLLLGCSKEYSYTDSGAVKNQSLQTFITSQPNGFRLVDFYSDIPIDFNPHDTILQKETALWRYVPDYLKDDVNVFLTTGSVQIHQNSLKISGNNATTIPRIYSIYTDNNKIVFEFVEYNYNPYKYYLHEIGSNYFIIYVVQNGARLFSKFVME